jgi:SAM-dependent methyltransferase
MSVIQSIQNKIQELLYGDNAEHLRRDSLKADADPDYMLYSPDVVGYNTTAEQQFLFQNLIMGLDPTTYSVLDIGCGRGDLYGFLREIWSDNLFAYTGVDMNPIMCDLAREKYGLELINNSFENAKPNPHDWVVAGGFFTQRRCETEDDDLQKMFTDIDKMYTLANRVVSFNLLSPINNTIHDGFFYVHPGLVMDMLIEKYQYVSVRHNYTKDVYTVSIYKL